VARRGPRRGFPRGGLAGLVAVAASRRRADRALAVVFALAAGLGGTPGWYLYLVGFFAWATLLARRTARTEQAPAET